MTKEKDKDHKKKQRTDAWGMTNGLNRTNRPRSQTFAKSHNNHQKLWPRRQDVSQEDQLQSWERRLQMEILHSINMPVSENTMWRPFLFSLQLFLQSHLKKMNKKVNNHLCFGEYFGVSESWVSYTCQHNVQWPKVVFVSAVNSRVMQQDTKE